MKKLFSALFLLFAVVVFGQRPLFDYNRSLGKGVNLGNVFEAPREGEWGNPFKDDFFIKIKQAGFNHVRLPIRWDTPERCLQSPPYTITPAFMSRIQYVVDLALAQGLKVIVNMHHHDEIFTNPNGVKPRFLAQWTQISSHFKDYSRDLMFEVMNEPHDQLTPELWNVFFADALTEIRKTNPDRVVLMGVAEFGGLSGLGKLVPPADPNVIVSIHYYNPFQFTHQGADWVGSQSLEWLGTKWNDLEAERQVMRQEFASAQNFSQTYNIPIHIGEFGAFDRADMASRVRWSTFLARYLESIDFSWAYWEWSAGFGVYNPTTGQYRTELLDALISNPLPEPTKTIATVLFEGNFTNTSGWNFFTNSEAIGSLAANNGQLNVNITRAGSEGWHAQLVRNGFNIVKNKMYRLSFEAKAANKNALTFYMGKASDPWNSYSGYNGISLSENFAEYSTLFTMNSTTDPMARMVFDLGTQSGLIEFRKIKLEEITLDFGTSQKEIEDFDFHIYPNPASDILNVEGLPGKEGQISIFDIRGRLVLKRAYHSNAIQLDIRNVLPGLYSLSVETEGGSYAKGVVVE